MRLIPFACILLISGANIGCNAAPVGPADTHGLSTAAEAPFGISFRSASAQAAVIIRNSGGCRLFNGEGQFVTADRDFKVSTQSTRQNSMLICRVKNVANSTGRAVRYTGKETGLQCGILLPDRFVVTPAWTETLSASGNATLRCHFKL